MDLSGDDAVELVCPVGGTMTVLDVIGQYGAGLDPGMQWGGGALPGTQNETLRRRCTVTQGDRNATNTFTPNTQWQSADTDNVSGLGAQDLSLPDARPHLSLGLAPRGPRARASESATRLHGARPEPGKREEFA